MVIEFTWIEVTYEGDDQKYYALRGGKGHFAESSIALVTASIDDNDKPTGKWWPNVIVIGESDDITLDECDTLEEAKKLCEDYFK